VKEGERKNNQNNEINREEDLENRNKSNQELTITANQ